MTKNRIMTLQKTNTKGKKENSFNEDVQAWLMKLLSIFDCRLVTITFMISLSLSSYINEIIFLGAVNLLKN